MSAHLGREHRLGPLHVEQDVREGPDGIGVTPHHHVGEAHVVIGGDLGRGGSAREASAAIEAAAAASEETLALDAAAV